VSTLRGARFPQKTKDAAPFLDTFPEEAFL